MDLDDIKKSENDFQKELENGMENFYPFWLQNHYVHLNMVLSKWHLTDHLETDMTYLTKSTDEWWVVFVEFELPNISLLTKKFQQTAELTKGIKQLNDWKAYVDRNPEKVRSRLNRFLTPEQKLLNNNPVKYKYLLIAGREKELTDERARAQISAICWEGMKIKTWDSMIENSSRFKFKLNVASIRDDYVEFKNMNSVPPLIYMNPNDYKLTDSQVAYIKSNGHDYDTWVSGESLCSSGGKYISDEAAFKKMKDFFKSKKIKSNK